MTSTVLDVTVMLLCVSASVVALSAGGLPNGAGAPTASESADRLSTETVTGTYTDPSAPGGDRTIHATRAELLALLVSEKPFGLAVQHGHEPIAGPIEATAAEGGTIHELDGRPAFDVYREAVREPAREHYDIDVDDLAEGELQQVLTFFEFGVRTGEDDYKVRWPGLTPDESGPLSFPGTIPEGTELFVMHSPKAAQIESAREAGRTAVESLDGQRPSGALVFDCACRGAILGEEFDQAVAAMDEAIGAPLAGFETYGEVNLQPGEMRGFHNTTSSILLFPA